MAALLVIIFQVPSNHIAFCHGARHSQSPSHIPKVKKDKSLVLGCPLNGLNEEGKSHLPYFICLPIPLLSGCRYFTFQRINYLKLPETPSDLTGAASAHQWESACNHSARNFCAEGRGGKRRESHSLSRPLTRFVDNYVIFPVSLGIRFRCPISRVIFDNRKLWVISVCLGAVSIVIGVIFNKWRKLCSAFWSINNIGCFFFSLKKKCSQ